MSHIYVGRTPRFLVDGRPVVFGTVLEDEDVAKADDATKAQLAPPLETDEPSLTDVKQTAPEQPAETPAQPAETPAAADTPAKAPADAPAKS